MTGLCHISPFLFPPLFIASRHPTPETRKRAIRLTYVVARLLLQRSLQSQFWHSYSRVPVFMVVSVEKGLGKEREKEQEEGQRKIEGEGGLGVAEDDRRSGTSVPMLTFF